MLRIYKHFTLNLVTELSVLGFLSCHFALCFISSIFSHLQNMGWFLAPVKVIFDLIFSRTLSLLAFIKNTEHRDVPLRCGRRADFLAIV